MTTAISVLDILLAVGGFIGGRSFIRDPSGAGLHMPIQWLKQVPLVHTYVWPGVFLLAAYGMGGTLAAVGTISHFAWAHTLNIVLGGILMWWIIIQLLFIPGKHLLQLLYFLLGSLLVILPLL